jgi:hypothetical protein
VIISQQLLQHLALLVLLPGTLLLFKGSHPVGLNTACYCICGWFCMYVKYRTCRLGRTCCANPDASSHSCVLSSMRYAA